MSEAKNRSVRANLKSSKYYPFNLDGPLCPLINNQELLLEFYDYAGFRQSIKQFCRRRSWEGKPDVPHSISSDHLKKLLISLFNSPEARNKLLSQKESRRYPFLHHAIWRWIQYENSAFADRIKEYCFDDEDEQGSHRKLFSSDKQNH